VTTGEAADSISIQFLVKIAFFDILVDDLS
jgi:hypothetical protein